MLKEITNMFRSSFYVLIAITVLWSVNCAPYYRHHNQSKAAGVALNFSINAFVKQDFQTAYSFLRSDTSKEFGVSELKDLIVKMHPEGKYPVELKAEYYEIIPNSGLIKIYLRGNGTENETHYYLVVTMPENEDYKISELYRKDTPYQKTAAMQPLSN